MIKRIAPWLFFALIAVVIIEVINKSFTYTYSSIETSLKKPYARAQEIYNETSSLNR